MECPWCQAWNSKAAEQEHDGDEARLFFVCDCGCEFWAVYSFDHCEIEKEPYNARKHYQSDYERDNPRDNIDNIIERR